MGLLLGHLYSETRAYAFFAMIIVSYQTLLFTSDLLLKLLILLTNNSIFEKTVQIISIYFIFGIFSIKT